MIGEMKAFDGWAPTFHYEPELGFVFDGLRTEETRDPVVITRARHRDPEWTSLYDKVRALAGALRCSERRVFDAPLVENWDLREVFDLDMAILSLEIYAFRVTGSVLALCGALLELELLALASTVASDATEDHGSAPPVPMPIRLHTDLSPPRALSSPAGRLIAA